MLRSIKFTFYAISSLFFCGLQGMEPPLPPMGAAQNSSPVPQRETNHVSEEGHLHTCATQGDILGIQYWVLIRDVSVNTQMGASGRTPLYFAVMARQISAIAELLKYGADKNHVLSMEDVQERLRLPAYQEVVRALNGEIKKTEELSMQEAVALANPDIVRGVLERETYTIDSYYPYTIKRLSVQEMATHQALEQAVNLAAQPIANREARQEHIRNVSAIIELLIRANPQLTNGALYSQSTPLHQAAELNIPELLPLLVHVGFAVNAQGESGHTPLYCALERNHIDAVNMLLVLNAERYHVPHESLRGGGNSIAWIEERVRTLCRTAGLERVRRDYPTLHEWYQQIAEPHNDFVDVPAVPFFEEEPGRIESPVPHDRGEPVSSLDIPEELLNALVDEPGIPFIPEEELVQQELRVSHDIEEPVIHAAVSKESKDEQPDAVLQKEKQQEKSSAAGAMPSSASEEKSWAQRLWAHKWAKKTVLYGSISLVVGGILYKIFAPHTRDKQRQPAVTA